MASAKSSGWTGHSTTSINIQHLAFLQETVEDRPATKQLTRNILHNSVVPVHWSCTNTRSGEHLFITVLILGQWLAFSNKASTFCFLFKGHEEEGILLLIGVDKVDVLFSTFLDYTIQFYLARWIHYH